MTYSEVQEVLDRIGYKDFRFTAYPDLIPGMVRIVIKSDCLDIYTGDKTPVTLETDINPRNETPDSIIIQMYAAVSKYEEHERREHFAFGGSLYFDPHPENKKENLDEEKARLAPKWLIEYYNSRANSKHWRTKNDPGVFTPRRYLWNDFGVYAPHPSFGELPAVHSGDVRLLSDESATRIDPDAPFLNRRITGRPGV